jgi:hypothetical protein
MAVKAPESGKPGVPAYMVSFGDMITLLLTFFILLVALADTQTAGLVGAGHGPLVQHLNAKGEPAILPGRLIEHRRRYKQDAWWVPDHEGSPDELVEVKQKLVEEVSLTFDPEEYDLSYEDDRVRLRLSLSSNELHLPARVGAVASRIAQTMQEHPTMRLRVSADVPGAKPSAELWGQSLKLTRAVTSAAVRRGVAPNRIDQWGWGGARSLTPSAPGALVNMGVTIELFDDTGD